MTFIEMFWIAVVSVIAFSILLIMLIVSGSRYSATDIEAEATDFPSGVKEGHGGMTAFLWLTFAGMFIWTIVYLILHWHEFAIITAYAS
jgi:hypothetical protein